MKEQVTIFDNPLYVKYRLTFLLMMRYQTLFGKDPKYYFQNIKIFLTTCLRESRESLDQHLLNSFSILSLLQMCYKSAEIPDAI